MARACALRIKPDHVRLQSVASLSVSVVEAHASRKTGSVGTVQFKPKKSAKHTAPGASHVDVRGDSHGPRMASQLRKIRTSCGPWVRRSEDFRRATAAARC